MKLWCWRRLLKVPRTARRPNQLTLKEINPEHSLEGLVLKLQYFDHLSRLTEKDPDAGKDWRQEEKGVIVDEMVGWHYQFNGHESEEIPEDNEGREAWCAAVYRVAKSQTWLKRLNNNNEASPLKRAGSHQHCGNTPRTQVLWSELPETYWKLKHTYTKEEFQKMP